MAIFVNRPNINFYQLDASCGNVKNHLQNVTLKRDTIFTEGKFQLIRLTPLTLNLKPQTLNPIIPQTASGTNSSTCPVSQLRFRDFRVP